MLKLIADDEVSVSDISFIDSSIKYCIFEKLNKTTNYRTYDIKAVYFYHVTCMFRKSLLSVIA